ncbi:MAG: hypothetical protein WBL95_10410 [Microcoleus sp.]
MAAISGLAELNLICRGGASVPALDGAIALLPFTFIMGRSLFFCEVRSLLLGKRT